MLLRLLMTACVKSVRVA